MKVKKYLKGAAIPKVNKKNFLNAASKIEANINQIYKFLKSNDIPSSK